MEFTIDNSAFHGMELIKLQLIITKVSITRLSIYLHSLQPVAGRWQATEGSKTTHTVQDTRYRFPSPADVKVKCAVVSTSVHLYTRSQQHNLYMAQPVTDPVILVSLPVH